MKAHRPQTATRRLAVGPLPRSASLASALGRVLTRRLHLGQVAIELPSGHQLVVDGHQPGPSARIAIHRWRALWRMIANGDIGFADSYIDGEWSTPNLGVLLDLAARNCASALPPSLRAPRLLRKIQHVANRNTPRGSRRNIAAHYDLGNEFYEQWLDAGMNYSASLYASADQTLERAQVAKLDRVLALLELSGTEDVLEIGCGWGSLAERVLNVGDCRVTGLTLSARQLEYAQHRLNACGLSQRADLRLQDYRDVCGPYDRIVSIEMLEAVGAAYWPTYFERLVTNLRPGGIAVLQVITIDDARYEAYRRRPDFIQTHVFPGGMLPTVSILKREIASAGLTLVGSEHFGMSYARTLTDWQQRFQAAWPDIERLGFDDRFKRLWEYYLAYCRAGFEAGLVDVGLYKLTRTAR